MRCTDVVIADRHPVVLQGLSDLLGAERDFRIVASCGDGASCIDAIRNFKPDIAVVDAALPGLSGLDILNILSAEKLRTRLVVFGASIEDVHLALLAAAGAYAVILKDVEPQLLVQTLRQVAEGRRVLSPASPEEGVTRVRKAVAEKNLSTLTDRERQIVSLVSGGLSNKEIGRRLNLSDGTIKVHLHHIFQKLDVSNRTALAAMAFSNQDVVDPFADDQGNKSPATGKR